MTAAQLANKLLVDEHPDVLRESAAWMAAELMEAEVAAQIGAELGERSPERRTHRNGYRPRTWDTRVGELELAIPYLFSRAVPARDAARAVKTSPYRGEVGLFSGQVLADPRPVAGSVARR
jgi:hypothetical protein